MLQQTASTVTDLLSDRYQAIRDTTEALAAPLSPEDQVVQSMPDVSPTKWHRAHVTWFFETLLLKPRLSGYQVFDPAYAYLFNSYYETLGKRHPRAQRGLITRPSVTDVADYRAHVDQAMHQLLCEVVPNDPSLAYLVELGLHHEQQHQELLLMDIKHVLSSTILKPAYQLRLHESGAASRAQGWIDVDGGIVEVGADGPGFSFDNEGPRHDVLLRPYRLADRLVTCGEWLEFMADGAYERPMLWLSDGWHTVQQFGWTAPLYWRSQDDVWKVHTLMGERPVDMAEPVVHVSYYEAEAFARWAGARLPTEFEWEHVAARFPVGGSLLSSDHLQPQSSAQVTDTQLYGDVWEWTSSAYAPYPGFRVPEGAVGEYNGKFMIDQQVLRGGSVVTPDSHIRATYRNFFPARSRWQFGGLRLATD